MNREVGSPLADWQAPVSYLPQALREPRRPFYALGVAWLTAFVPTLALSAAVSTFLPRDTLPSLPGADVYIFFLLVVAAPVLETLMMGGALLLLRLVFSPTVSVLISAVGWGVLHSSVAPAWGLVIWWPFLIFSTLFLTWRNRSVASALAIAAASHALHNLAPALLLLLGADR